MSKENKPNGDLEDVRSQADDLLKSLDLVDTPSESSPKSASTKDARESPPAKPTAQKSSSSSSKTVLVAAGSLAGLSVVIIGGLIGLEFSKQATLNLKSELAAQEARASRETAARVAAGAIAKKVLKKKLGEKFKISAAVIQLGILGCDTTKWNDKIINKNPFFCPDKSMLKIWEKYLLSIRKAGSSCGAIIEVRANGIPAGLGAPIYSKLDSDIASAMMSINAVKGVNIGSGMSAAQLSGEENSDEISQNKKKLKFTSNNAGGILGGISSGQEIIVSFAVKPTSSILKSRKTINKFGKNTSISVRGRHDPCVGIRAVPIGEAMINCVLLDHFLMNRAQCG